MFTWAVRRMLRRDAARLQAGDVAPLLSRYADDAVLVFPGSSSWGGEHRGKPAIEAFLRRFLAAGLTGEPHDILVSGPPWRMTVCVLFTDEAPGVDGEIVYRNRAILFLRLVWGRIVYHEDFEDTHKIEAFDAYLREHGLATAR